MPLYGIAACQRCLEEFETLLDLSDFGSPTWARSVDRLFDASRVANMLLAAADDELAAAPGALYSGALCAVLR